MLRRRANRSNAEITKIKAALQKLNEKYSASGPIHAGLVETSMETNTEKRESTASLAKALELKREKNQNYYRTVISSESWVYRVPFSVSLCLYRTF